MEIAMNEKKINKIDEFLNEYCQLTTSQKIAIIACLAKTITIYARGTYIPGTMDVAEPQKLREFNELEHKICNQMTGILFNDHDYPEDDIFLKMLFEFAKNLDCTNGIFESINISLNKLSKLKIRECE